MSIHRINQLQLEQHKYPNHNYNKIKHDLKYITQKCANQIHKFNNHKQHHNPSPLKKKLFDSSKKYSSSFSIHPQESFQVNQTAKPSPKYLTNKQIKQKMDKYRKDLECNFQKTVRNNNQTNKPSQSLHFIDKKNLNNCDQKSDHQIKFVKQILDKNEILAKRIGELQLLCSAYTKKIQVLQKQSCQQVNGVYLSKLVQHYKTINKGYRTILRKHGIDPRKELQQVSQSKISYYQD